jgi:hypothetical protein
MEFVPVVLSCITAGIAMCLTVGVLFILWRLIRGRGEGVMGEYFKRSGIAILFATIAGAACFMFHPGVAYLGAAIAWNVGFFKDPN